MKSQLQEFLSIVSEANVLKSHNIHWPEWAGLSFNVAVISASNKQLLDRGRMVPLVICCTLAGGRGLVIEGTEPWKNS